MYRDDRRIRSIAQTHATRLEVLFAPDKAEAGFRVLIALDVECGAEHFRAAEEDTCFGGRVDLADGFEDHVPVGATEVGGGAEAGDGVLLGVGVVDHDVGRVVGLDLGGEILQYSLMPVLACGKGGWDVNVRCGSRYDRQDPAPQ
jgi:hypothetical protein